MDGRRRRRLSKVSALFLLSGVTKRRGLGAGLAVLDRAIRACMGKPWRFTDGV